jgi:low temperature requirement protein LtrA
MAMRWFESLCASFVIFVALWWVYLATFTTKTQRSQRRHRGTYQKIQET